MNTAEKVAYLKGLAEGLSLGRETKEEKLLAAIIDTLDTISEDVSELQEAYDELSEELDAVSDDLAMVEELVYDDDYDDDDCCCDEDYDDCCAEGGHDDPCCHDKHGHGGHRHGACCPGHHGVMYEVTCPACDNTITIDEEVLNLGSIQCPNCGGTLEFDAEGSEDGTIG